MIPDIFESSDFYSLFICTCSHLFKIWIPRLYPRPTESEPLGALIPGMYSMYECVYVDTLLITYIFFYVCLMIQMQKFGN